MAASDVYDFTDSDSDFDGFSPIEIARSEARATAEAQQGNNSVLEESDDELDGSDIEVSSDSDIDQEEGEDILTPVWVDKDFVPVSPPTFTERRWSTLSRKFSCCHSNSPGLFEAFS